MSVRMSAFGAMIAALSFFGACDTKSDGTGARSGTTQSASKPDASGRCPHQIKQEKCPFCTPRLVESDGFCGEHGVAEALCAQCRPYLKAAFRAKGDWCGEHNVPESQCVQCNPALKEKMNPGEHGAAAPAGDGTGGASPCEHGIARTRCPFCTPSLIESDGLCREHDVAEALCVKCRPYLEGAFRARGDWCNEHRTPESQCVECHPDLKNKPGARG
ncbi:MAG: hypothetical protein FJ255_10775 [Phycisphaerae bacterium]|nr:hypothetical protein [Phycisphaerae bacterium]